MRRYPFVPSKTSLTAVGSPQTYPAVLASMVWLVDLLMYDYHAHVADNERLEVAIHRGPQPAPPSTGAASASELSVVGDGAYFFAYLTEAYDAFLQGNDAQVAELDGALEQAFDASFATTEREVGETRREVEALKAELAATRAIQSSAPKLRASVAELTAAVDKLSKAATELEGTRDGLVSRMEKEARVLAERGAFVLVFMNACGWVTVHSLSLPTTRPPTPTLQSANWSAPLLPWQRCSAGWTRRSFPPRTLSAWQPASSSCGSSTPPCATTAHAWRQRLTATASVSPRRLQRYGV